MIVAVCVDDRGGMLFNRRRQSQDRLLREDLLRETGSSPLWMSGYTARQFSPQPENVRITEDLAAVPEGYCFVETQDPGTWATPPAGLIVYRWNRVYPADLFCTLPLEQWTLVRREEFAGSSHEKITKEVYTR